MPNTTVYDIRLRYLMDDQAQRGVRGLDQAMRDGARSASQFHGNWLTSMAALAAGGIGVYGAKKAFIDFNSTMEQSKLGIAGLMGMNMGGTWVDNLANAGQLVKDLKDDAAVSLGTTQDMVNMAKMLAQPIGAAGLGMKGLRDYSRDTVVAAASMGIAADVAARDVDQALRGQFHSVDQFTGKLLGTKDMGYAGEAGRAKFNALSAAKRASELSRAYANPALQEMGRAQGDSWEGVMSTFESNVQDTLGKVGLPLFRAVTAELQKWNTWIAANGATIDSLVNTFAHGITEGFSYLKSVIDFIVQHKDLFLSLATAWAATKGVGMVGAGAGAVGNLFGGFSKEVAVAANEAKGLAATTKTVKLGLGEMVTRVGGAVDALAMFAVGLTALAAWIDREQGKRIEVQSLAAGTLPEALKGSKTLLPLLKDREALGGLGAVQGDRFSAARHALISQLSTTGLVEGGQLNTSRFRGALNAPGTQAMVRDWLTTMGKGDVHEKMSKGVVMVSERGVLTKAFADFINPLLKEDLDERARRIAEPDRKPAEKGGSPKITINHIDVASDDPDRFIFRLAEAVRDAAHHPSAAKHKLETGL